MSMSPRVRKFALTAHVACSVGLLGAIAAFLVLAVVGLVSADVQLVRAALLSTDVLARFVVVPLALAALGTGVVQSLGTPWGLLRHAWVFAKLVVTAFATAILLAKLELIARAASLVAGGAFERGEVQAIAQELVLHAAGGLLVLLVPVVLSIYKPRGLTAYGKRMQHRAPQSGGGAAVPAAPVGVRARQVASGGFTLTLRRGQVLAIVGVALLAHVAAFHIMGRGHMGH